MKNEVNNNVTMVNVAGMMVPEDKVEARLQALARGRQIHEDMVAAKEAYRAREAEELKKKGYTTVEINNYFRREELEDKIYRGFGVSRRCVRIQIPA